MPLFRRVPAPTEATQWFRNGDHPEDQSVPIDRADGPVVLTEGKVVRRFRAQHIPGDRFCHECGNTIQKHGELHGERAIKEERICPGDYIVTDPHGKFYRMRTEMFETLYEPYPPRRNTNPAAPEE